MEKIVKKLIDESICDADSYFHNGNILVIYTEKKEWVFELKKNGDLWYNYYFFKDLFSYLSMDVVENQHYITKYVEDALQNGVKNTCSFAYRIRMSVEDALQNGVKNTYKVVGNNQATVEDALQNGVKNTNPADLKRISAVEDALRNGVKNTSHFPIPRLRSVEDVIQNGVINKFMGLFGTNRQKV